MSGTIVKVPLGKNDKVLKEWHKLATLYERNISRSVECVIIHYMNTGQYLPLGNIGIAGDNPPTAVNLYFADNSPVLTWLDERMKKREKKAAAIKRILKKCIAEDEEEPVSLVDIDSLYDILDESAESNTPSKGARAPVIEHKRESEEKKPPQETVQQGDEKKERKQSAKQNLISRLIPEGMGLGGHG